jgi:TP901 family phage tail tape measure protein
MAEDVVFNIKTMVTGLRNIAKLRDAVNKLGNAGKKNFTTMLNKMDKFNGALDQNNKFLSRSADRIGFMAFQFTFLEGIARRVLQSIQQFFTEVINDGASSIESMVRAVAQSGIDISGQTEDSAKAVKFLNDALLDMGSGGTIFNINEVGDAMREIGKATDLTGTELQKANKLAGVTQQVLRLMTIEQVDSAEAAKTIIKTMNNFGLSLSEAARVTDVMINVNQSSAITLDELARSFGFASSQAVDFGLDVETTGALLGVLGNRLGQGAGAAGRNFRQLLVGLKNNALKLNPALQEMGISLLDNEGNIKPFLQFLKETKTALDEAGQSSDAFKLFLEKQLGLEVRAADALAKLTQVETEEIERAVESAKAGDSSALENLLESTPEAQIKKLKNSVEGLKAIFVTGLAPALGQVAELFREITRDKELQELMLSLGQIIGEEVVPVITYFAKEAKKFLTVLKRNEAVLRGIIQALIFFVQLLIATLIIASVGKVMAAFGSIVAKLTLGISNFRLEQGKAQAGMKSLRFTMLTIIAVVAGIIIAFFAVKTLFETLKDGFQEGEESIVAVSAALLGLGLMISFAVGGLPGLAAALIVVAGTALAMWLDHIGAIDAFKDKWDEIIGHINDQDDFTFKVAIVLEALDEATQALFFEIGEEIGKAWVNGVEVPIQKWLEEDPIGQLVDQLMSGNIEKMVEAGFALALALATAFITLLIGEEGLEALLGREIESMPDTAAGKAAKAGAALGEAIRKAFIKAFTDDLLETILKTAFGPTGVALAGLLPGIGSGQTEQRQTNETIESGGYQGPSPGTPINLDEVIDTYMPANLPPALAHLATQTESAATELQITAETMEEQKEQVIEMVEEIYPNYSGAMIDSSDAFSQQTLDVAKQASTIKTHESATKVATAIQNLNTSTVNLMTTKENKFIEITDKAIIELAREINKVIDMQTATDNVSIALTKLAIEGTEAARRISTLKVSDDGKFSMDGRRTNTTFGEIPSLQANIGEILATEIGEKINLVGLQDALAQQQAEKTVNVGGITINITGNVDDKAIDDLVTQIQDTLEDVDTNTLAGDTA